MEVSRSKQRQKSGAATIRQVAERAGVHPGTVSRALQGDERVAPATLERIQRIAREMNFTPNIAARILSKGTTETIAIAVGGIHEHYYAQLLYYLGKELVASNYKRLLLSDKDVERDLMAIVNSHAVDGLIAIDTFPRIDEVMLSPEASMLPCVYAGVANLRWTELTSVDIVKVDLSGAVRDAVQAMLNSGCRRVAYVVTSPGIDATGEVRIKVYEETVRAAGQVPEIINLNIGDFDFETELIRQRFSAYIQQRGCPDGILFHNDEITMLAQRVLKDLGLRIPDDVQIVGCDGLTYMDYFDPPLSTIVQPAQEMCALAWRFLQRRMSDPTLPRQTANLEAHLKVRPSLKNN